MINKKRLTQVETALTPKAAVLLWLRREHQGKTTREYIQGLVQLPASAAPRPRIGRQVAAATQSAMKGHDPDRIQRAAWQARMDADFLIVLVNRANSAALDHAKSAWFRVGSCFMQLYSVGLKREDASDEPVADLRAAALEVFSIHLAIERIQSRHFDGECILLMDVQESLELQSMILREYVACLDLELEKQGCPELAVNSVDFRTAVSNRAAEKARYICALAKSAMLQEFGRGDEANAVLRPYVLAEPVTSV
jgi:hypothetical protein